MELTNKKQVLGKRMKESLNSLQFLRFIAIFLVLFAHLPVVHKNSALSFLQGGGNWS